MATINKRPPDWLELGPRLGRRDRLGQARALGPAQVARVPAARVPAQRESEPAFRLTTYTSATHGARP